MGKALDRHFKTPCRNRSKISHTLATSALALNNPCSDMARQDQSLGRAAVENTRKRKDANKDKDKEKEEVVRSPPSQSSQPGATDPPEHSAKKRRASGRSSATLPRPSAQTPTQRRIEAKVGTTTSNSGQPQHGINQAPADALSLKITELKEAGTRVLTFSDSLPDRDEANVEPPVLNLELLKLGTSGLPSFDDLTLYGLLSSNDVLTCLKQFALEMSRDDQLRSDVEVLLTKEPFPFKKTIEFLAQNASRYVQVIHQLSTFDHPQRRAVLFCMKHLRRLQRCIKAHFMYFLLKKRYPKLDDIFYMLSAGALATVCADLRVNKSSGFFWKMFDTRFAEPMVAQARQVWDKLLILPGSTSGADTASSVAMVRATSVAYADESRQGTPLPALGAEISQDLQDEVTSQFQKLQSEFARAMNKNPELMTIIPPATGHIEPQEPTLVDELVGFPPRKKGWASECDQSCKQKLNLHTIECGERRWRAREQFAKIDDEDAADPTDSSYTFQLPRVNKGPKRLPPGLNSNRWADPFSVEEALLALERFKGILSIRSGPAFDSAFEWTSIAEVLAGRSVADCIRFYNANKQIINTSVESVSGQALPLELGDELECAPYVKELQAKIGVLEKKIDDRDGKLSKQGACLAEFAEENEFLQAEHDQMEKLKAENEEVWETMEFVQMENCQYKIDKDKLEFDLQTKSQKVERLQASVQAGGLDLYPKIRGFGFLEDTLVVRPKRQWHDDRK